MLNNLWGSLGNASDFSFPSIVLHSPDIRVKEAFRQPSAGIYVVIPGYLGKLFYLFILFTLTVEVDVFVY